MSLFYTQPKHVYRYAVSYGLRGCYLPNSYCGAYTGTTRRELASLIRDLLAHYKIPASLFDDVNIKHLWSYIKRGQTSVAHFQLNHKDNCLAFHGLTEEEYNAQENDE